MEEITFFGPLTTIRQSLSKSRSAGHAKFCLCTHFSMTIAASQQPSRPSNTTALSLAHAPSILAVKSRINARPSDYYKDNMNNVSEDLYTTGGNSCTQQQLCREQRERYNSNPRGQMVIAPNKVDDMALPLRFLHFCSGKRKSRDQTYYVLPASSVPAVPGSCGVHASDT